MLWGWTHEIGLAQYTMNVATRATLPWHGQSANVKALDRAPRTARLSKWLV